VAVPVTSSIVGLASVLSTISLVFLKRHSRGCIELGLIGWPKGVKRHAHEDKHEVEKSRGLRDRR